MLHLVCRSSAARLPLVCRWSAAGLPLVSLSAPALRRYERPLAVAHGLTMRRQRNDHRWRLRDRNRLCAAVNVQLAEDIGDVFAHRRLRDAELLRDLPIAQPAMHQLEDLPLAPGQLAEH